VAVVAEAGMDQKEQAETAVAVVAAVELTPRKQAAMAIRRQLPLRKAIMAAPTAVRLATRTVAAVAALVPLVAPASRQPKAVMVVQVNLQASRVPQSPMAAVVGEATPKWDQMVLVGRAAVARERQTEPMVSAAGAAANTGLRQTARAARAS
jgi:hypothetical protein